jgi:hypothetical protein
MQATKQNKETILDFIDDNEFMDPAWYTLTDDGEFTLVTSSASAMMALLNQVDDTFDGLSEWVVE